jgi:regulator of sigma E protease
MQSVLWGIILIGILIFAHELGHFLFAKLFKVKVLTFSLGFGGPISIGKLKLSVQWGETEYRIAWFPIGGLVRMLGDESIEGVSDADRGRSFLSQPLYKRFLIILAGPLFSVLLALPIFFAQNVSQSFAPAPVIGMVVPGSPAAAADIRPDDVVVSVSGKRVETWEEVEDEINSSHGTSVALEVLRGTETIRTQLVPVEELDETGLKLLGERWDVGIRHERQGIILGVVTPDSPAVQAGLSLGDRVLFVAGTPVAGWSDLEAILIQRGMQPVPISVVHDTSLPVGAVTLHIPVIVEATVHPLPAEEAPAETWHTREAYTGIEPIDLYINGVIEGSPAATLGIQRGDKIIAVFGAPIQSWEQFSRAVAMHLKEEIPIQVRHNGQLRDIRFTPSPITPSDGSQLTPSRPGLGVEHESNLLLGQRMPRPHRLRYGLRQSMIMTGTAIYMNVMGFVRLFQGRVAPSEAIGGPIMIISIAGESAKRGIGNFLNLMAFISVLLGLLNLLPIPILDGGQIAFIVAEAILRRPLSQKTRVVASYIGLVFLITLMAFAFAFDINRFLPGIFK